MRSDIHHEIESAQSVLFDMDGTIFDTEPLHAKALMLALNEFGKKFTEDELHHRFYGKTDTSVFQELLPDTYNRDYPTFQKIKNKILINIFDQLTIDQKKEYTAIGLQKFLQSLRRSGKKIALVSSSEQEIVEHTLQTFSLTLFFDIIIGRNGTHLNKPNPSPYFKAMRHFKTLSKNTLIFEDSPSGLKSAHSTGAVVIQSLCFNRGELSDLNLEKIFTNGKTPKNIKQFDHLLVEHTNPHSTFKDID